MALIDEARDSGARLSPACKIVGLDPRTMQRWRTQDTGDDMRMGPKTTPANKLSKAERDKVVSTVNQPEYRDLPPCQIVPQLADKGQYVGSESTIRRILVSEGLDAHRGRKKRKSVSKPKEKTATAPGQLWSWDISYLPSPVLGMYFYLYLVMDVWSRKIVGHVVHDRECTELASVFMEEAFMQEGSPHSLILHQDNGSPMKAATLKATLDRLSIGKSYSRPNVSDDNPYSESLFGTAKTRPEYPRKPFEDIEEARAWALAFVVWYNDTHCHSSIGFVTPSQRHAGESEEILAKRRCVYEAARRRNPERWSREIREWSAPSLVYLNPDRETLDRLRN